MTRQLASFIVCVVIAAVSAIASLWLHDDPEHVRPEKAFPPVSAELDGTSSERSTFAVAYDMAAQQTIDYLEGQERERQVRAYLDALEAQRLADEAARMAAARQVARPVVPSSGAIGGDCAPVAAIIGWGIVNRESGGKPNAQNPSSGAYGCSQTLPSHYAPGGVCAGLDMFTIAGQTECTQRLYDRGGLRPWGGG